MKLSIAPIALHHYFDTDKDQRTILEFVRECGFTCVDYDIKADYLNGDYKAHAKRLRDNLAELGMTAPQGHAPIQNPFAYAANDVVLIILWTLAAAENISYLSVIICFVLFLVNDLYGFISWKRMEKRQLASV